LWVYYYSHQFQFSTHGLQRIKERLNIKHMDDFQAKDHCIKLLEKSRGLFWRPQFSLLPSSAKKFIFRGAKRWGCHCDFNTNLTIKNVETTGTILEERKTCQEN
jgi:hypothetical protein